METVKINTKLSNEEKETILTYDAIDKIWTMDTTIQKHMNRALKQGWTTIKQYVYEDGTICGMVLTASDRSITIRNTAKKEMSEKQLGNLNK
jgi:hypothetical protein